MFGQHADVSPYDLGLHGNNTDSAKLSNTAQTFMPIGNLSEDIKSAIYLSLQLP